MKLKNPEARTELSDDKSMSADKTHNARFEVLKLRLLVGYLGEKAQFAWWPTSFFEPLGASFLDPVFVKTKHSAQYQGVLESARLLHDEHLSVGCFHLFRLPEEFEQHLYSLIQQPEAERFIVDNLHSQPVALASLAHLAGNRVVDAVVGPSMIGKIDDLRSSRTAGAIATAYLAAFNQAVRTFPYLIIRQ